jgi:hypothetical protein
MSVGQPFIPSQRETRSTSGWAGETKQGWDNVPVNVYNRELKDFVPGDNSMANHPFVGVVAQPYLKHAEFPKVKIPDGNGSARPFEPKEISPGLVANKYEIIFTQRGTRHVYNDQKYSRWTKWRHQTRGSRPEGAAAFTPGITLPQLNRLLQEATVGNGQMAKEILANLVFFGVVDSVGPGESMNPDRNQKNYVTVIKQRVVCWNVWENLELALQYLYLDVVCDAGDRNYRIIPTHAASHKDHADEIRDRAANGVFLVHSYFVGRSGPHEQGGVGQTVAPAIEEYMSGKKFGSIDRLPKIVIYILDH